MIFDDKCEKIYSGGIDNVIKVWDLRKNKFENNIEGHDDSITSLSISFDGSYILSNSMDNTVRLWDIRPFVVGSRL